MNIFINRAIVNGPWGGGNAWVSAFYDTAMRRGHRLLAPIEMRSTPPDVILIAGLDRDELGISARDALLIKSHWSQRHNVKIVARINECDARKGTVGVDESLSSLSSHIDGTVFVSSWLRDYFGQRWQNGARVVIHNGVDNTVFKPAEKHASDKIRIVTHHWSNNYMKGFDIYEAIDALVASDPRLVFTYIGRERGTFKNTVVIPPLTGVALAQALAPHDIYVSASRFDPGPNHVLESVSCGIPTYVHVDGGGCVEFAGADHTYKSFAQLESILHSPVKQNTFRPSDWRHCIDQYLTFMETL